MSLLQNNSSVSEFSSTDSEAQRNPTTPLSTNIHLRKWVQKMAQLMRPAAIHWVDGSQEEYESLCAQMMESGTFTKLNEKLWPGCFYARSDPNDVARVEDRTFVCSLSEAAAGVQQLGRAVQDAAEVEGIVPGMHARPNNVCVTVQHGADRFADVEDWCTADGFAVCRGEHADHGAHRQSGDR
jgi:GTP-dependent phosphoenolpyruvate carboxykinase